MISFLTFLFPFLILVQGETVWSEISTQGSIPRCDFSMILSPESSKILVFGGNHANFTDWNIVNQFQQYDFATKTWSFIFADNWNALPVMRHASEYDEERKAVILFSGARTVDDEIDPLFFVTQTLMFWNHCWLNITRHVSPSPREFSMSVNTGGFIYLFGGHNAQGFLNDFWRFSFLHQAWEPVEQSGDVPKETASGILVYEKTSDSIFLIGGRNCFRYADCVVSTVYRFDIPSGTWSEVTPTESVVQPIGFSLAAGSLLNDQVYIFGGEENDYGHQTNDLWRFDLKNSQWHKIETDIAPSARVMHKMIAFNGKLYMHAGFDKDQFTYFSDLWELTV